MKSKLTRLLLLLTILILNGTVVNAATWCERSSAAICLTFEEATTQTDKTSNGNDCTVTETVNQQSTDKKFGDYAIEFIENNNAKLDCGSDSTIDNTVGGTKTIVVWHTADTYGEGDVGCIYSKGGVGGTGHSISLAGASSQDYCFKDTWTGEQARWCTTGNNLSVDGTYQHIAVTYDASSTGNDPILYVDGVADSSTETNNPFGTEESDASQILYIGISTNNGVREWDGDLDDFAYFKDEILTSTDINSILDNGILSSMSARRVIMVQ